MENDSAVLSGFDPKNLGKTVEWGKGISSSLMMLRSDNVIAFIDEKERHNALLKDLAGRDIRWNLNVKEIQETFVTFDFHFVDRRPVVEVRLQRRAGDIATVLTVGQEITRELAKELRRGMQAVTTAKVGEIRVDPAGELIIQLLDVKVDAIA